MGAASHHVVNYRDTRLDSQSHIVDYDFGGGLKSDEDLIIAFERCADGDRR